jgi:hypothetical protein
VQAQAAAVDDSFVASRDRSAAPKPPARPADGRAVDDVLTLLARAVQQFHTYPPTSPLCVSAIESCQRALAALQLREQLIFRVTPAELIVDDIPIGKGTQVGQELARRLHRASVASVAIDRGASVRELARFCQDLVRCGERGVTGVTLLEMVTEHGLDRIAVSMAARPEVLEIPAPPPTAAADLARERTRFEAQLAKGGVVNHLYPPQKGWVRLDPGAAARPVSLLDLAVLADDPATLASMLLRLTDEAADVTPAAALERKYSDVAMLVSALDPRVARRMFARLARAVLDLDSDSRQTLLRRTVLPGLLDGRVDGAILRDFPDIDLAESLCLLLDLETAAPELLSTALARLDLPAERQAAVLPLLDAQLKQREAAAADSERQSTLARHARELVRVDGASGKSFAEFAAFDLSLDGDAETALEQIRMTVPASDVRVDQLTCLWHLMCLEPNPETVGRFLGRSFSLLALLESGARGGELPSWLASYRQLAERVRGTRPDVADVIESHLAAFCTPERAAWIADLLTDAAGGREAAAAVITALGAAVAAPLVDLIEREAADKDNARRGQDRSRAIAQVLNDHAVAFAPALVPLLDRATPGVVRILLRALGSAGPGYEEAIAPYASSADGHTAREALRALARAGTEKAASVVVAEIVKQRGASSIAAEETLWHFPPGDAQRHARALLGRRDFTTSHPQATERLLDRAARAGNVDLGPVLTSLAPMRFRIWNPALARVARKAHAMLKR